MVQRGSMNIDEYSARAIGIRLRITREAIGLNQVKFARAAGLSAAAYNQLEKGKSRPSIDAAIRLCKAHRLTLDWIYMGDNSGLVAWLAELIRAIRQRR